MNKKNINIVQNITGLRGLEPNKALQRLRDRTNAMTYPIFLDALQNMLFDFKERRQFSDTSANLKADVTNISLSIEAEQEKT